MSDLNDLLGSIGGMGGLGGMLGGLQQKMAAIQEEAAAIEVVGEAGGGLVKVTANGSQEVVAVAIDPGALDDAELLEDLVRAATNDALVRSKQVHAEKLAELTQGLGLPPGLIPGM